MLAQPFDVLPAIDVLEGRAVRLRQGRRDAVTIEGGDPVELGRRFLEEGATRLHVVDLDGAFSGAPTAGLVARIATLGLPIQIGGGYRTIAAIEAALAEGADRVIAGTAALSPSFVAAATDRFGDGLVVAVDARDGKVAVDGWTRESEVAPGDLARMCAAAGARRLLVTSTRRDGSLAGPDLDLLSQVLSAGLAVIAAGGISSLDDLAAIRALGCEGAVTGSALLAGRFTLREAIAALAE